RKPSWRRISAMRSLMVDRGQSMVCLRDRMPLRIRVRKSEMGSVIDMGVSSPARLDDAGDVTAKRQLTEAEPAHLELAQVGAGAAAALAAVAGADLELVLLGKPILVRAHCAAPAGAA